VLHFCTSYLDSERKSAVTCPISPYLPATGNYRRTREKSQQLSAVTTQIAVRGQSLTRTLCKKLEQLRTDPVRLRAQFDDAKRQRDGTDQQGMEEVEKAIC
jgi:hypothetical protein